MLQENLSFDKRIEVKITTANKQLSNIKRAPQRTNLLDYRSLCLRPEHTGSAWDTSNREEIASLEQAVRFIVGIKSARLLNDGTKELCLSPLLQRKEATAVTTVNEIYSQRRHPLSFIVV